MKWFIAVFLVALTWANDSDTERIDLKTIHRLESRNISYIVSGEPAAHCEFPSIVFVLLLRGGKRYMCGGTLIDKTHVLTAAHCVAKDLEALKIHMGSNDNRVPTYIAKVSKVEPNGMYRETDDAQYNDVAMLTLTKEVPISDCIKPINMASAEASFVGHTCITAGWGRTGLDMPISHKLLKISLPIMPYTECHGAWSYIEHEHICAGDWNTGGPHTCVGDSGGPLYCQSNGEWVLAGIISFGKGCKYGPSVFASVPYFRAWIDQRH